MKQIITLFGILFLLTGCSNDNNANSNQSPVESDTPSTVQSPVQFSLIAKGDHFNGNYKNTKVNLVIKDEVAWNTLKSAMTTYSLSTFTETNIDFTKYQIIAVFDQIRMSGGHTIDITSITEDKKTTTVKVESIKTGDLTSVVTQPFHIVKISKTANEVVFK